MTARLKRHQMVSEVVTIAIQCDPCGEAKPHAMAEMADGAIAFVCCGCRTQTVLREEPVGEPASAV